MIEVASCLEHGDGDPASLLAAPVAGEARSDESVVVRPHCAVVVAERVERRLPRSQGAYAPSAEQSVTHDVVDDRIGLGVVHDPAPEQMAHVRGQGRHLVLVPIEG